MNSSASAKMGMILLAFAFVLTPAICGCFGLQDQAMAANSQMEVEHVNDHGHVDKASNDHQQSNNDCDGAGCDNCSYASDFDGLKSDRFTAAVSIGTDSPVAIDGSNLAVTPIVTLVASVYPRRGPPPFVRTTLVALHSLLLI